ncbi:histidine--tRNA ligase [Candidatus Berkelbacteria bacterium]|nr:histidine--tRNA ligase [Candidatus Berkelbacteria bacterium]
MKNQVTRVRGMRDILPDEQKYWSNIMRVTDHRLKSFGFQKINTPIIEAKELFIRGAGEKSDIVQKELFGVIRTGTRNKSEEEQKEIESVLRPEGTASIVRSYIENGMKTWPQPVKLYSFMELFRYDRPQKGRYRQHTQLDVEVLGDEAPLTDAMTLLALWQILQDLNFDNNAVIELNSIGDRACRSNIEKSLNDFYKPIVGHLCEACQERYKTNPLRLLDCKEKECIQYREQAPHIVDSLCPDCRSHFMLVLEYLDEAGVPYDLNPFLVRGLDYYTRTTFEIRDKSDKERQSSLAGGGRYDNLIESLGGEPAPAFGFGMGIDRIVQKMIDQEMEVKDEQGTEILIIQLGDRAKKKAIPLLVSLGKKGLAASMALGKESLKSQLRSANKMGAKLALIVGEREALDGTVMIRNMLDSTQETVDFEDVETAIEKKLEELAQD